MKAPPARNASCSTVNASSLSADARPNDDRTRSSSHVAMSQTRTPFASSAGSISWRTTRPSRTTIVAGARTCFGGPRSPAGRTFVSGRAQLLGRHRAEARQVEIVDAAVAPDLFLRRRPGDRGKAFGRGDATRHEPFRPAQRPRRVDSERGGTAHPTAPSMLSSIRRDSSTAYSIGSVLVIGSMKPLTIIAVACCSVRPRLWR